VSISAKNFSRRVGLWWTSKPMLENVFCRMGSHSSLNQPNAMTESKSRRFAKRVD